MQHFSMLSVATLALALAMGGPVEPAEARSEAANTLSVTSLYCEDMGGGGQYWNTTYCEAYVSGGTGVYTYHWNVIQTTRTDYSNGSEITGVCSDPWYVQFTVTDSWGTKATRGQAFDCEAGYED